MRALAGGLGASVAMALGLFVPTAEAQSWTVNAAGATKRASIQGTQYRPNTWFVDQLGTPPGSGTFLDPYVELSTALASPNLKPGDSVQVAPGVYAGTVFAPPFGVSVHSTQGAAATVIDGQFSGPALALFGTDGTPVRFEGFTFRNGYGTAVSPIFSAGGGVQAEDAMFELTDCSIEFNDAFWGGGLFAKNSVGTLTDCSVLQNTNTGFGARGAGVMADGGSLLLRSCEVEHNESGDFFSPGHGGGIYAQGGVDLDVIDCAIESNRAEQGGGGTFGTGDYLDCTLRWNVGQFGGGANASSGATFTNCLFEGNEADSLGGTSHFGGGVYGAATIDGCTFRDNISWGGVAGVDGGLVLDSVFVDNLAIPGYGGVNDLTGGAGYAVVLSCSFLGNVADGGDLYFAHGGGAAFSTLVDCDLDSNEVRSDPSYAGGGTYFCDVLGSRLVQNYASGSGGGAYGGSLSRCLLWDNHAEAGGGASDADLDHCTLEGNYAAVGDGLWMSANADALVSNCILYYNDLEEIATDPMALLEVRYSDVAGGWLGLGNIDKAPRFWNRALDDFHLRPSSPCIDSGDPAFKLDPDGSITDMGALRADPKYTPDGDTSVGPTISP